jgi:ribosomal protein S6--L-glutamate ligase
LNIVLLSRQPELFANLRLAQAAQSIGCSLTIVDPLDCTLLIQDSGIQVLHPNYQMVDFDYVLPRYGPMWQRQGHALLRQLECQGARSFNRSTAIADARNKNYCFQLFQQNKLPFPKSACVESVQQLESLLQNEFCFPVLLKQNNSARGSGVEIFHEGNKLLSRATELYAQDVAFMIQEFITESFGVDYRLFVLNGQVIASMKRTALEGEFRANVHLGARAESYAPSIKEQQLAIQATTLLGLDVAGVDIIYGKNGPLLLEVNACPGFEALERVSGLNVAEKMLDFMISKQMAK